jgi:hypothetical protein
MELRDLVTYREMDLNRAGNGPLRLPPGRP